MEPTLGPGGSSNGGRTTQGGVGSPGLRGRSKLELGKSPIEHAQGPISKVDHDPPQSWLLRVLFVEGAVLGIALGYYLIGIGGLLLLSGVITIAIGSCRRSLFMGPAAWAAAVITEFGVLAGCLIAIRFVQDSAITWYEADFFLLVPIALGLVLSMGARKVKEPGGSFAAAPELPAARPGLAPAMVLLVSGPVFIGALILNVKNKFILMAAVMGGDGADHVNIIRGFMSHGGLALSDFKHYPALTDGVGALVMMSGPSRGGTPSANFKVQILGLSHFLLVNIICVAVLLGLVLLQLQPVRLSGRRWPPLAVVILALACSTFAYSSAALYPVLAGGAANVMPCVALTLATIMIGIEWLKRPSPPGLLLLSGSVIILLLSWPPLVVTPMVLIGIAFLVSASWREGPRFGALSDRLALGAAVLACLFTIGVLSTNWAQVKTSLATPGAFSDMAKWPLFLIAMLGLMLVLPQRDRRTWQAIIAVEAVVLAGIVETLWIQSLVSSTHSGARGAWTYYAMKLMLMLALCTVWLLFVPLVRLVTLAPGARIVRSLAPIGATFVLLGALWVSPTIVRGENVYAQLWSGLQRPSATSTAALLSQMDRSSPFLFWNWSPDGYGEDRLMNFWVVLRWQEHALPGEASATWGAGAEADAAALNTWAYTGGASRDALCKLLTKIPRGTTILTRLSDARAQLDQACGPIVAARAVVEQL